MKGEEDKPLPPSKPRKPYKRNPENKVKKCEIKRKRCQVEEDMDSHVRDCLINIISSTVCLYVVIV